MVGSWRRCPTAECVLSASALRVSRTAASRDAGRLMRILWWVLRILWIGGRSGKVFHVKLAQAPNRLIGNKFCTPASCAKPTQLVAASVRVRGKGRPHLPGAETRPYL